MTAELPGCARPTTSLGFGCSALSGGTSKRHSIRLVHAAHDGGIRHFDVARSYGMGTAEGVLGEALKSRRDDVTLATKVGIDRPKHAWAIMTARSLAAPLRKLVPGLTRSVGASAYTGMKVHTKFEAKFVEASVTDSLRRLRTDYVDLLLLHEIAPEKVTDELLSCLVKMRERGMVRALGTGTSYANTLAIRAAHPDFFDVWQYSWSVLDSGDAGQSPVVPFTITHRAIQRALGPLRSWLAEDAGRAKKLSEAVGVDLANPQKLGDVLIGAALANNPGGIALVSSRQQSRVEANARLLADAGVVATGARLIAALAAEPGVPWL